MNRTELETVLRGADPAPPRSGLDERARHDLRRILDSSPEPMVQRRDQGRVGRPTRRALGLAAAVVLVTGVTLGVGLPDVLPGGGGTTRAYAATPPLLQVRPWSSTTSRLAGDDVSQLLEEVASRTSRLPDDVGTGTYAKTELETWSLWTSVDGDRTTSVVVPQESTTWVAADGSGREVTTTSVPGQPATREASSFSAGERATLWPLGQVADDVDALTAQLGQGHPFDHEPAERLVAVQDLYREQPLDPQERAAVLRFLARTPGLALSGSATDRAGRPGLAVHLDTDHGGLPTRMTMVIDERTGRLLGSETTLTETAGKLNVPVPSVIDYTTYRASTMTDDLG